MKYLSLLTVINYQLTTSHLHFEMNCTSFWNINKGVRFVDMKLPQRVESKTWEDLQILFDEKSAKLTKEVFSKRVTRVTPAWMARIDLQRLKNKPKSKPSEPFLLFDFPTNFLYEIARIIRTGDVEVKCLECCSCPYASWRSCTEIMIFWIHRNPWIMNSENFVQSVTFKKN